MSAYRCYLAIAWKDVAREDWVCFWVAGGPVFSDDYIEGELETVIRTHIDTLGGNYRQLVNLCSLLH